MSLSFVRPEFVECPTCRAKPGSPALCRECLERRDLYSMREALLKEAGVMRFMPVFQRIRDALRICDECQGQPNPECREHGR